MDSKNQGSTEILAFITSLVWRTLCLPLAHINGLFKQLITSEEALGHMLGDLGLKFADGVYEALLYSTAPEMEFFKTLPPLVLQTWGIYHLILTRSGSTPLCYVGSVQWAIGKGYKISSKGVLLKCPLPSPEDIPTSRLLIVAVEAALSYAFWTHWKLPSESKYSSLCPWSPSTLLWGGLCSYNPLVEGVEGSFHLTPEELADIDEKIREKNKKYGILYQKQQRQRSPDRMKAVSRQNNQRRTVLGLQQAARQAIKDSKKFHCNFCNVSFPDKYLHARHDNTKRHKATVAKAIKMGKSPS
ncbi:MAG: hypothetical protein Q9174_004507 [Haloplaca sp. 1 TL-2023]